MSSDLNKQKNKRTITIEDIENGVRVTVVGPPYLVATGAESESTRNLATDDIGGVWLSDFAPDTEEDRAAYSAKHWTPAASTVGPSNATGCAMTSIAPSRLTSSSTGRPWTATSGAFRSANTMVVTRRTTSGKPRFGRSPTGSLRISASGHSRTRSQAECRDATTGTTQVIQTATPRGRAARTRLRPRCASPRVDPEAKSTMLFRDGYPGLKGWGTKSSAAGFQ
jgi:hypothetical protein